MRQQLAKSTVYEDIQNLFKILEPIPLVSNGENRRSSERNTSEFDWRPPKELQTKRRLQ
jgi:hypothetical protein